MKITTQSSSEINFEEVAAFIYDLKSTEIENRGLSLKGFENTLQTDWRPFGGVLAHSNGKLMGAVLLYRLGNSDLIEVNPGSTLGSYPIVASGFDSKTVGDELIKTSKSWIVGEGFNALYIDIPWDPAAPQASYDQDRKRFGELGFEVIQQVRQMKASLPAKTPPANLPSDFELAHILTVDEEELYQCHHQAYLHSDVQYYFQMEEQERRADFERIFSPAVKASSASLVLTQEDRIVGYIMLFTQGGFSEVMSLAVHPDYRRRGLGKYLNYKCLEQAAEEGCTTMHLIVDVRNVGAAELYGHCGFLDAGGNMTFKWKA